MFAPIGMLLFQLMIYLFDARNTTTNNFSSKIMWNISLILIIVSLYFYGLSKSNNEKDK